MAPVNDAMERQHGGDHYKGMGIQPFEFGIANVYDPAIFSIMKYVARHQLKAGKLDLDKAHHIVDIREAQREKYGPLREAATCIDPETFIIANRLGEYEARIIRLLHQWATRRQATFAMTDEDFAEQVKRLIETLAATAYPED